MAEMKSTTADADQERQGPVKEKGARCVRFQTILRYLRAVFRAIQNHSRWVEKECGLSAAQLWLMWEIFNVPGLCVSELADVLAIKISTCSNMIDKLRKRDLVQRQRSEVDQRVVQLFLTETGIGLLAKAPRPAQGALTDVLQRLPDDVLSDLETCLSQLVTELQIKDAEASMIPISDKEHEAYHATQP